MDELLGEAEDPDALAPELFAEEDGGGVGKDRDVLVAACAQNCCATPSAAARSPGHAVEMQSTRPDVKRVALYVFATRYLMIDFGDDRDSIFSGRRG